MSGAIPPLPNTPSWRGVQLKKAQGQLHVYLKVTFEINTGKYLTVHFRSVAYQK
jgi:hypothetical protein